MNDGDFSFSPGKFLVSYEELGNGKLRILDYDNLDFDDSSPFNNKRIYCIY